MNPYWFINLKNIVDKVDIYKIDFITCHGQLILYAKIRIILNYSNTFLI